MKKRMRMKLIVFLTAFAVLATIPFTAFAAAVAPFLAPQTVETTASWQAACRATAARFDISATAKAYRDAFLSSNDANGRKS